MYAGTRVAVLWRYELVGARQTERSDELLRMKRSSMPARLRKERQSESGSSFEGAAATMNEQQQRLVSATHINSTHGSLSQCYTENESDVCCSGWAAHHFGSSYSISGFHLHSPFRCRSRSR